MTACAEIRKSMDYEIQRCTRHCAQTGRELIPEELFYSVLLEDGTQLKRLDYSIEAWKGPPEGAIGWWKSQMPSPNKRRRWAPNDVMLRFFEELGEQAEKRDMRYVLALLLVRRRVLRQEEGEHDEHGREVLVLYCPRNENTYRIPAVLPDASRVEVIQEELARLLE